MTKKIKSIFISSFVLVFALTVATFFFAKQFINQGLNQNTTEIFFEVLPGQNLRTVSLNLEKNSLIKSARLFEIYAKLTGTHNKIKKGEYSLNAAMRPQEIMNVITSGKSVARNFTVAEGLNIFDLADLFEKNNFCSKKDFFSLVYDQNFIQSLLGEKVDSLEGYLFPETYKITKFDTAKDIITQMVNRFLSVYNSIEPELKNFKLTHPQRNWTRHQHVTFASIVEKETGAKFERPLVSSVFHNRLNRKMRLQTDPTVLYGKALELGSMPKNITRADLLKPNRYNTYVIPELPPTPIANPGKEALIAALQPAQSKFLFFVSHNDGTHHFSEDLSNHNLAVQKFQKSSQARENKSWRDLQNKNIQK